MQALFCRGINRRWKPPRTPPFAPLPCSFQWRCAQDEATFEASFPKLVDAGKFAARSGCKVALLGIPPSSEQPRSGSGPGYIVNA